jgi:hypothetical protein
MSFKTRDGKTHQSHVLFGENGLPVDSIATISGSYIFLEGVDPISYSGGTVTLPVGSDLTALTTAKARYTGKYILLTNDDRILYIDRLSIDVSARTFVVSTSDKIIVFPTSVDTSAGWKVAEADIVNRLATTSAAKIDSIEFRDLHFQMELDGDPVTVRGENGNTLEPNPDGSVNVVIQGASAGSPTIINTLATIANDEYMVSLPSTARRFMVKARNSATLRVTYIPNEVNYLTVSPGAVYTESNLITPLALTIYIKSNKPNTVIETVYWE